MSQKGFVDQYVGLTKLSVIRDSLDDELPAKWEYICHMRKYISLLMFSIKGVYVEV